MSDDVWTQIADHLSSATRQTVRQHAPAIVRARVTSLRPLVVESVSSDLKLSASDGDVHVDRRLLISLPMEPEWVPIAVGDIVTCHRDSDDDWIIQSPVSHGSET